MRVHRWQKRWFVLSGNYLSWWEKAEHENTKAALGSTDVAGAVLKQLGPEEILVTAGEKEITLNSEQKGGIQTWTEALSVPASESAGAKVADSIQRLTLGDDSDEDELVGGGGAMDEMSGGAMGFAITMPASKEVDFRTDLTLEDHIGKGICSESKKAILRKRPVVVKILHNFDTSDELLSAFSGLVGMMSMMPPHKNVLEFVGACTKPPDLCVVYDRHTANLESLLESSIAGAYDMKKRTAMALDVAVGLQHIHNFFGAHGGLRTTNCLIKSDGSVCVSDFGFGKVKEFTGTGARIMKMPGLCNYTAPEVLRSDPATKASDVYSIGAILWELALQQRPFDRMDQMQQITNVGFGGKTLEVPAGCDKRFASLIPGCVQQKAGDRTGLEKVIAGLKRAL